MLERIALDSLTTIFNHTNTHGKNAMVEAKWIVRIVVHINIISHCGKKNMGEWLHVMIHHAAFSKYFHNKCVASRKLLVTTVPLVLVNINTENCTLLSSKT